MPTDLPARAAALVTGGSGGIGAAIIARLTRRGIPCVNLDREIPKDAAAARHVRADLTDRDATARALRDIAADHDILWLVNNAGIVAPGPIESVDLADLDRVVAVNLSASIQCAQAVLPAMQRARFGRIVNISSRAALGKELRSIYAATKAGLLGLTRTLALELGQHGITVNAIGPGPIETELFRASNPPDSPRTHAILNGIPLRRLGQPDDIAAAASFFLSDDASFITGQTLFVCGGLTVGLAVI